MKFLLNCVRRLQGRRFAGFVPLVAQRTRSVYMWWLEGGGLEPVSR